MVTVREHLVRGPPSDEQLRYAAAFFAYVVASLHLFHPTHGALRIFEVIAYGLDPVDSFLIDPRPILFVLSALALMGGVLYATAGGRRRPLYALGMALMVVYIVGYFGWHLAGHGGFLPTREPIYHGVAPHVAVVEHITANAWAAASKLAETVLLAVLAVLYVRDA